MDPMNNCLLILCPGCDSLMTKCKFIYHCENECIKKEIRCINYALGCNDILPRLLMKHHLNVMCNFKIKEICSCNNIILYSNNDDILSSQCIDHCGKCITNSCEGNGCSLVDCVNKCGMRMHSCKLNEHVSSVCSQTIVPCINHWCGCNAIMLRCKRGSHLKWCTSSVIACGVEWSRDVTGCKIYQRYLDEGGRIWSQKLQRRLVRLGDKTIDRAFVAGMNLRDEINLCVSLNNSDLSPMAVELFCSTAAVEEETQECFSLHGRPTTGIGANRRGSLSRYINGGDVSRGSRSIGAEAMECDEDLAAQGAEEDVTWRLRQMTKNVTAKSPGTFTFQCGQAVPRAEYDDHYRQHCDLECQMDGWVEMQCPLVTLGCTFTVMRLSPPRSSLVYHPRSNYYGVRYRDNVDVGSPDRDGATASAAAHTPTLLQLPMEVLIRVCALLDGCSLRHAASAHPRLQEATTMLIGGYCVTLQWTRKVGGMNQWRSQPYRFLPATRGSSSSVRRLQFTDRSVGAVTSHLAECSFNGPRAIGPTTPRFCLHAVDSAVAETVLPAFLRGTCHGPACL